MIGKAVQGLPKSREGHVGGPMPCPACAQPYTTVTNSRPNATGIGRRRGCAGCGHRFTTHEIAQEELSRLRAKASAFDNLAAVAKRLS